MSKTISAVLFDLDGTLVDSAPDLLGALDAVRMRLNLAPADRLALRHHASRGAAGILTAGLADRPDIAAESLIPEFLDHYGAHLWQETRPFSGISPLLEALSSRGLALGIVTNKHSRFAEPIVDHAGWRRHFGCIVTGDRVVAPKPDPEPVARACRMLESTPATTLFVGDDRRDIESGRTAGTLTAVAGWGYLQADEVVDDWGADFILESPQGLLGLLTELQSTA